jgi:hypothetical protein
LARHPIYAAYLVQYLGIWLGHLTVPFGIAVLAWLGLIAARIHYEEMVLQSTFPQYAEYRRQVGMFGPRLRQGTRGAPELTPRASPGTLAKQTLAAPALSGDGGAMRAVVAARQATWHKS